MGSGGAGGVTVYGKLFCEGGQWKGYNWTGYSEVGGGFEIYAQGFPGVVFSASCSPFSVQWAGCYIGSGPCNGQLCTVTITG